jgi:hypothetical protein
MGGNLPPLLSAGVNAGPPAAASTSAVSPSPSLGAGGTTVDSRVFTIRCVVCGGSERVASAWRTMLSAMAWLRSTWTPTYLWGAAKSLRDEPARPLVAARPLASKATQADIHVRRLREAEHRR